MKRAKKEILKKIHGGQICQIVSTAARLKIADFLQEGPKTVEELAHILEIQLAYMQRFVSALLAMNLLEESEKNILTLTEEGRYLISDHEDSVRDLAVYKGSSPLWNASGNMYEGLKQGKSPFELTYKTDFFTYIENHFEEMRVFQNAMNHYEANSSKKILDLYPFEKHKKVVDIGGGTGNFLQTIINRNPHIEGIVFDLPPVINYAKTCYRSNNIQFKSGNFFKELPNNADCYLLRNILHDWSDDKCIEILKNIEKHMAPNSKLLIMEKIIDREEGKRLGIFADMTMFVLTSGGKERTMKEFQELITTTSLQIKQIYRTTGSKAFIEVAK